MFPPRLAGAPPTTQLALAAMMVMSMVLVLVSMVSVVFVAVVVADTTGSTMTPTLDVDLHVATGASRSRASVGTARTAGANRRASAWITGIAHTRERRGGRRANTPVTTIARAFPPATATASTAQPAADNQSLARETTASAATMGTNARSHTMASHHERHNHREDNGHGSKHRDSGDDSRGDYYGEVSRERNPDRGKRQTQARERGKQSSSRYGNNFDSKGERKRCVETLDSRSQHEREDERYHYAGKERSRSHHGSRFTVKDEG